MGGRTGGQFHRKSIPEPSECTRAARQIDFTPTKRGVPFGEVRRVATVVAGSVSRVRGDNWSPWGADGGGVKPEPTIYDNSVSVHLSAVCFQLCICCFNLCLC